MLACCMWYDGGAGRCWLAVCWRKGGLWPRMHTDVDVAGELHSWTAAMARPTCVECVDVLRTSH